MKKLLLGLMMSLTVFTATAQMDDVWRQIQQNKRKAAEQKQIEDVLSTLPQDYIVAYAKNGILCYLLKDGKRVSYLTEFESVSVRSYVWNVVPRDMISETLFRKNNLAELIDDLSNQGWKMSVTVGGDYEVYTFNRPKGLAKTAK